MRSVLEKETPRDPDDVNRKTLTCSRLGDWTNSIRFFSFIF